MELLLPATFNPRFWLPKFVLWHVGTPLADPFIAPHHRESTWLSFLQTHIPNFVVETQPHQNLAVNENTFHRDRTGNMGDSSTWLTKWKPYKLVDRRRDDVCRNYLSLLSSLLLKHASTFIANLEPEVRWLRLTEKKDTAKFLAGVDGLRWKLVYI